MGGNLIVESGGVCRRRMCCEQVTQHEMCVIDKRKQFIDKRKHSSFKELTGTTGTG